MSARRTTKTGARLVALAATLFALALGLLALEWVPETVATEMPSVITWLRIDLTIAIAVVAFLLFRRLRQLSRAGLAIDQEELLLNNLILKTQQETSPDAILVVDEDAMIISYNRRFIDLWGLPEAMVEERLDQPVLEHVVRQVADPETFLARVMYLYQHREEHSFEEIELKDGRIIDRHSSPMFGKDGRYYGRVWYFRDITVKKQREREILALQDQLHYRTLQKKSGSGPL